MTSKMAVPRHNNTGTTMSRRATGRKLIFFFHLHSPGRYRWKFAAEDSGKVTLQVNCIMHLCGFTWILFQTDWHDVYYVRFFFTTDLDVFSGQTNGRTIGALYCLFSLDKFWYNVEYSSSFCNIFKHDNIFRNVSS